jgi:hypothetical protein
MKKQKKQYTKEEALEELDRLKKVVKDYNDEMEAIQKEYEGNMKKLEKDSLKDAEEISRKAEIANLGT